jgi:hypothetical protein
MAGVAGIWRRPSEAAVLIPTLCTILLALCAQALVWERWIVPVLPIFAILAAIGLVTLVDLIAPRWGFWCGGGVLFTLTCWAVYVTIDRLAAHAQDPRQAATAWVRTHVPPDRTILVEHAAFDLLRFPGRLLFPLGSAGCVDVRSALDKRPSYRRVNDLRQGSPIVDLGHVDPARLATCDADVLFLSNYARYKGEPQIFRQELATYKRLLKQHHCVATFPGHGPRSDRSVEVCLRVLVSRRTAEHSSVSIILIVALGLAFVRRE